MNAATPISGRGTFRVRGDVIEVCPMYEDYAYRIELWATKIESLSQIDPLLDNAPYILRLPIISKTHYVMTPQTREQGRSRALRRAGLTWHAHLEKEGKLVEAQRLYQRTMFDLE